MQFELGAEAILNLHIFNKDAGGAMTVRRYFQLLLKRLWEEGEGFSGKRPFGNSGWHWDFASSLIDAGVPVGSLDSDGYVQHLDSNKLNALVDALIDAL